MFFLLFPLSPLWFLGEFVEAPCKFHSRQLAAWLCWAYLLFGNLAGFMLIFINFHLLISGIRAQWRSGCCCRVRLITRSVNRIRLGWALLTPSFAHKLCIIFIYYRSPIFISSHEICRIKRHFYSQESDCFLCCCCCCCQTMFRSFSASVGGPVCSNLSYKFNLFT